MMRRDFRDYLRDVLESINDVEDFVGSMSFEAFAKDKKTLNAVVRSIEIIGEASKNIPESWKEKHKDLPWKQIAEMRDKLNHAYFGVDVEILWKAVKEDVPRLKESVEKMLQEAEG